MQDKDIFQGYEITSWEFSPRIYKIIAAATVFTLLPIFALGQTNLLSASACDSPFVGTVCDVLDTVYIGTKILAKNTGYYEGEYTDIELRDENEIIWRDETEIEPPLEYPEGYFEIANRDELAALRALEQNQDAGVTAFQPSIPPIIPIAPPTPKYNPPRTRNNRRRNAPIFPKTKDKVLEGKISDDPIADLLADADKDKDKKPDGTKPDDGKKPEKDTTASNPKETPKNPLDNQTAKKSDPLSELKINKKPLYDVADITLERVEAKQIDLTQKFVVRMNGVVTPEGMLDEEKSGWGLTDGDERMIDLAKIAISKVGVSGWLKYLSDEDAMSLNIMFGQTDEELVADVRSDLKDINKAKTAATGIRGLIQAAILADKNGWKDLKDHEVELLKAASISNEGKILVIKFNLDKKVGQQIINTQLAEYKKKKIKEAEEAKKKSALGKPSGKLSKPSSDENAGK